MMIRNWGIIGVALFLMLTFLHRDAKAQSSIQDKVIELEDVLGSLSLTDLLIINENSDKVTFNLKNAEGNWKVATAPGQAKVTFAATDAIEIKIITNGSGTVHYKLRNGRRYKIVWDKEKKIWDVNEVVLNKSNRK